MDRNYNVQNIFILRKPRVPNFGNMSKVQPSLLKPLLKI